MASHLMKEEPTDALDVKYIKAESNETACEKQRQTRQSCKRKICDSPPPDSEVKKKKLKKMKKKKKSCDHPHCRYLYCYLDVDSERHECNFRKIFPFTTERFKFMASRDDFLGYKIPDSKSKTSNKVTKKNKIVSKILKCLRRNNILKSPLLPHPLNLNLEEVKLPHIFSKDYAWKNDVNNPIVSGMDHGIECIVDSALLHTGDHKARLSKVLKDLNEAVKFEGFTNQWNWFGSYLNGVVTRFSDLQFCFECVPDINNCHSTKVPENVYASLLRFLQADTIRFRNVIGIQNVESPCIKVKSKSNGNNVFITFSTKLKSSEMNVARSLLTKFYLNMSPELKYLSVFVEIVLRQFTCNRDYIKKNTDTIFWLVAFFMQLKKLLPAVIDVRKAAKVKYYVDGWDCSLPESYSYPTEPVSLYGLLLEFFQFYKEFDFLNYVICPYLGCVFRLSDFERLQIPKEQFSLYLRQLNNPDQKTFIRSLINLQDPTDLCCNINEYQSRNTVHLPNVFKLVCHSFSQRLPKSIEEMKIMGCFCKISQRKDFLRNVPRNLTHYTVLIFETDTLLSINRRSKLNQTYVLEAIRKIMETIFQFEKKSIVISQNVTQKTTKWPGESNNDESRIFTYTFPVIYFEYCSSECTWKNDHTKRIIYRGNEHQSMVRIYLTCEICLDSESPFIRVFIQGEFNFVIFLHAHLSELLRFAFNEIVPDVVE